MRSPEQRIEPLPRFHGIMVALFLAAFIAAAGPAPSDATPSPDVAVIMRSASTNTAAWTIALTRGGTATISSDASVRTVDIGADLAARLYADLASAGKLDALAVAPCMKSASFGTTTSIRFANRTTPDLECAGDDTGRGLRADVQAIATAAGMTAPSHRLKTQPVYRRTSPNG